MSRRRLFWVFVALAVLAFLVWRQLPDGRLHIYFHGNSAGDTVMIRTPAGRFLLLTNCRSTTVLLNQVGADIPFWRHSIDAIIMEGKRDETRSALAALVQRYRVGVLFLPEVKWNGPGSEALQAAMEQSHLHAMQIGVDVKNGKLLLMPTAEEWQLRFGQVSFRLFCRQPSAESAFCHLTRPLKEGESATGLIVLPQLPAGAIPTCGPFPCYVADRGERLEFISDGGAWWLK